MEASCKQTQEPASLMTLASQAGMDIPGQSTLASNLPAPSGLQIQRRFSESAVGRTAGLGDGPPYIFQNHNLEEKEFLMSSHAAKNGWKMPSHVQGASIVTRRSKTENDMFSKSTPGEAPPADMERLSAIVEAKVFKLMPLISDALERLEKKLIQELRGSPEVGRRESKMSAMPNEKKALDLSSECESNCGDLSPKSGKATRRNRRTSVSSRQVRGRSGSNVSFLSEQIRGLPGFVNNNIGNNIGNNNNNFSSLLPLAGKTVNIPDTRSSRCSDPCSQFGDVAPSAAASFAVPPVGAVSGHSNTTNERSPPQSLTASRRHSCLTFEGLERANDIFLLKHQQPQKRKSSISNSELSGFSGRSFMAEEDDFDSMDSEPRDDHDGMSSMRPNTSMWEYRFACEGKHRATWTASFAGAVRQLVGIREGSLSSRSSASSRVASGYDAERSHRDVDQAKPGYSHKMSITSMRETRQTELVDKVLSSRCSTGSGLVQFDTDRTCAFLWMQLTGILPWIVTSSNSAFLSRSCSTLNRVIIALLLSCTMTYSLQQLVEQHGEGSLRHNDCDLVICIQDTHSPILALALGCLLSLISIFFCSDQVVGSSDAILTCHLKYIDMTDAWQKHGRQDMFKIFLFWLCLVGIPIYASFEWQRADVALRLIVYAFTTNVFLALAFSVLNICRGFTLGIHFFCSEVIDSSCCDNAVENWNLLQALLRRACLSVARSFIFLLTSALAAMFLPVLLDTGWMAMLPGAVALLVIVWVSFAIGNVTSTCDRVPPFINTLDFGEKFDFKRQYVVDYISHSRAGFYMFDVRVTAEMVVKSAYVGFVIIVGFATHILSQKS